MNTSTNDLWLNANNQFLRAERLLEHCLLKLNKSEAERQQGLNKVAFELEQLLLPLIQLNEGIETIITEMSVDRQDNRLQRWQGQLQQLLSPLDNGKQNLQELVEKLDQSINSGKNLSNNSIPLQREERKRNQLQELLALRQKQVLQLQAEVNELQKQLFESYGSSSKADQNKPANPENYNINQIPTPKIFN